MPVAAPEIVNEVVSEIVRAGAGAGKTYTLTHQVMDLADATLAREKRLPRVVVTTFTRKATQELRERLMLLALEERPHLIDFVNSRAHLVVSTIHGIMDLFLKRYGSHIDLDPAYQVIDGPAAEKIARQTLRTVLLGDSRFGELLETFSFNGLSALVRRVDAVLSESPGCQPFQLEDFQRLFDQRTVRVREILREAAARIRLETDKANFLEFADCCQKMIPLLKSDAWPEKREVFALLYEAMPVLRRNSKGAQPVSEPTLEIAKEARSLASELLEPVYDPGAWEQFTRHYQVMDDLARRFSLEFRKRKNELGKLEIGDLEHLAMKCLREHPDAGSAFAEEWDFWLIDEFQDTSPFQVELLRRLSGERPSFIVGDPQQSIYLFRGARSEVFALREEEIRQSGGQRRTLSVNRRSRPELLLFFNDFFARLDPPFQPMEPFFKEGETLDPERVVAKVFIGRDSELSAPDDAAEKAAEEAATPAKGQAELNAIIEHIRELLAQGARPEEICILARTNKVLAEIAERLSAERLPAHLHAASGFFDRREVRDALALLKFLVNPHDGFNTIELLRSPWFKVPDPVLAEVASRRSESLWQALVAQADGGVSDLEAVARLRELLQLSHQESLTEAFHRGLITAGFIDFAHVHDVSGRREANLWKLLARLQTEERRAGFNPLVFISGSRGALKLEESSGEGDAVAAVEPNRINLMTIHASKGLEFPHVILPRMHQKPRVTTSESFTFDEDQGRWAVRAPFGEERQMTASLPEIAWLEKFREHELAEHARVLYVALTRASQSVFLSWTEKVNRDSWADRIRLDLEPGLHREASYSYFVEQADEAAARAPRLISESVEASASRPRSPWRVLDSQESSSRQGHASVSDLIERRPRQGQGGGEGPDLPQLLKLASHGTAVHKLMELLKYPSRERLERLIVKWFPDEVDRVLSAVSFVRNSQEPPLIEIIANGEVEKGFAFMESGLLVEGQIDLWGRTDRGEAWIVDYKTGNPAHKDKAFTQMGLYALALRKSGWLTAEERLKIAAVYPFAQKIFIADEPDSHQVLSWLRNGRH